MTDFLNEISFYHFPTTKSNGVRSKICSTCLSHSTLYPDVLKIKTIIVVKQNFAKIPFVSYYLQIHDLTPGCLSRRVARNGFENKKISDIFTNFVSQQLWFLLSKHLDTMLVRRIVSLVEQIFESVIRFSL